MLFPSVQDVLSWCTFSLIECQGDFFGMGSPRADWIDAEIVKCKARNNKRKLNDGLNYRHGAEHFRDCPQMACDSSFHCRGYAKRLMNAAEVVVHEVKRYCVHEIFYLFGKGISQAGESAHGHAHREVLAFDVTGGDVGGVWTARDDCRLRPDALRGTVAGFRLPIFAVQFHECSVINIASERALYRVQINAVSVGCKLNAARQSARKIGNERPGVTCAASADQPRNGQFRVGINRRPSPDVADAKLSAHICGHVLFLRIAERPDFVALNAARFHAAHRAVMVLGASAAHVGKEPSDRALRCSRHAASGANGIALDEGRDYLDSLLI